MAHVTSHKNQKKFLYSETTSHIVKFPCSMSDFFQKRLCLFCETAMATTVRGNYKDEKPQYIQTGLQKLYVCVRARTGAHAHTQAEVKMYFPLVFINSPVVSWNPYFWSPASSR